MDTSTPRTAIGPEASEQASVNHSSSEVVDAGDGVIYLRTLEELTGLLLEDGSLAELLDHVLELTANAISSCAAVSVTVVDEDGRYRTAASSPPDADAIDVAQYELSQGPCIDSLEAGRAHHLRDLDAEHRWPRFCERARRCGYRSMLSVPLLAGPEVVGALNVVAAWRAMTARTAVPMVVRW